MGLYSAPLAYTGYHPDVTGPPTVVNSTVRAATQDEVNAGQLDYVYVSPATLSSGIVTDLSSPPPIGDVTPNSIDGTFIDGNFISCRTLTCRNEVELGYGNTTADVSIADSFNTVPLDVTILCGTGSSGNCTLKMASNPLTTIIDIGNTTTLGPPRVTTINGGAQTQNDTLRLMFGAHSAGTQSLNIFSGACTTPSAQNINIFSATSTSTQTFNLFASTTANSTANLCTGFAASTLNLGNANVASSVNVGNLYFSNATSVAGTSVIINSQRSGQCIFSDIILAGTTVNLFMSSSFVTSSSVFIASVSCADNSPAVLLSITRINPGVGSVAFRVTNAGASDTVTPISINFLQII